MDVKPEAGHANNSIAPRSAEGLTPPKGGGAPEDRMILALRSAFLRFAIRELDASPRLHGEKFNNRNDADPEEESIVERLRSRDAHEDQ